MKEERRDQPASGTSDFTQRLEAARAAARAKEATPRRGRSAYDFGIRVATEMAVAVAVGFGLGWYLDEWLGTRPWMMLLLLPIGAAAGIMNVMRAARIEAARQVADLQPTELNGTNQDKSGKR